MLRLGRGGPGPRAGAPDGSPRPVSVGPLPQPGPLLGHLSSFGLREEPETNGVVERWHRTLKEHVVYGRVFQYLADVRTAVAEFVERYNRCWRLEKLAYRTPLEVREEYELRQAA